MAQTETKVLTTHVPLQLAKKVDQMTARLERSRSWINSLKVDLKCI
jgi:predicted transcriptional regulator